MQLQGVGLDPDLGTNTATIRLKATSGGETQIQALNDSTLQLRYGNSTLAFNGTANFPPGSVIPFFQSLGLSFGRDQNAFTGFDQTTYQLILPSGSRESLEKGMLYMSDVALRMSLFPAEVDSERQIILEEKRSRSSAQQRVQDQIFERLAPESTLGRRLPIGIEPTIKSVMPARTRSISTRRSISIPTCAR